MSEEINISIDELRELYLFLEKANELFHQPFNYRDQAIVERFAEEQYPIIRKLYYETIWNKLPQSDKNRILDE